MKSIGIACDHAGFELKELLKETLLAEGYEVQDFGTNSLASTDYPDHVHPLAIAVNEGDLEVGIAICGSAQGVCMVANKYPNVRAAVVWCEEIAKLSRQHNDANVICLPARFLETEMANTCLNTFLSTEFEGGRHQDRVNKISGDL
ncbi:MAG: ribose 5-phosphate isomerase B [Bacteroidia bacterium]